MDVLSFQDRPLWLAIAVFCVSAAAVWWSGGRLAHDANRVSAVTGIGRAAVGMVLLGGITSLPEIATSLTAAIGGSADLAVNNLVGGVAFQLVILAVADALMGKKALTSMLPRADLIVQAAIGTLMLAVIAAAVSLGELGVVGFGVGSALLVVAYAGAVAVTQSLERRVSWRPADYEAEEEEEGGGGKEKGDLSSLVWRIVGLGLVILVAGFLLTRSGEAIAERTGLGSSFFGAVFLAGSTSLPEFSSAITAAKIGRPQLAIGDVLGGNMFNMSLIFLVDLAYRGDPVLGTVGRFSVVAAMLGVVLNAVLIVGIVERRDRTIFRMGYDSAAILILYAAGLVLLFQVRGGPGG